MTANEPWVLGFELAPHNAAPLSRTQIVKYQGASGDFDAAHHDDAHARGFGYPGVFSLGMLHAGQLSAYVQAAFEDAVITAFKVQFKTVVFPGDVLTFGGRIERLEETAEKKKAELALTCINQDGRMVVEGRASIEKVVG